MIKWILKILITFLTILTTIFCWTFYSRLKFDYNSEGNYFDEKNVVVYHEQAVFVYGTIAFVLFCLTFLSLRILITTIRRVSVFGDKEQ